MSTKFCKDLDVIFLDEFYRFLSHSHGTVRLVAIYIAECQRVLEKTGVRYKMHGYGTNIEGPWFAVSDAIHACHVAVHAKGAPRIATDIRIGTRVDREITDGQSNEDKVKRVEDILRLEK